MTPHVFQPSLNERMVGANQRITNPTMMWAKKSMSAKERALLFPTSFRSRSTPVGKKMIDTNEGTNIKKNKVSSLTGAPLLRCGGVEDQQPGL